MTAISEMSKTDLVERWNRAKGTVRRMRAEGEQIANRGIRLVMTTAGGATDGALRGFWGEPDGSVPIPGTEVDAPAALGTALGIATTLGLFGDASDYAGAFVGGVLAGVASRETEQAIKTARAKK